MAAEQQEQNRSEEPTPFKLRRARERGMVPRSIELGFLGGLVALLAFSAVAGRSFLRQLTEAVRATLGGGIAQASPDRAGAMIGELAWVIFTPLALLGATILVVVITLEIVQLRGLVFSAHPLKPDFSRLNPAAGLKRLFSPRLFKETIKNLLKAAVYSVATWLVLRYSVAHFAPVSGDPLRLPEIFGAAAARLLTIFLLIAFGFMLLDQVLVRRDFLKQMRMSRREVTREAREREGEPRIKAKRKQLHGELTKAAQGLGKLAGSDLLVVNPEHFAVALAYDPAHMAAPQVTVKGRDRFALLLKEEAYRRGIPVISDPPLARALYRASTIGREIAGEHYQPVAALYIQLHRQARTVP